MRRSCLISVGLVLTVMISPAYAGEAEDALIAKVVEAYGGDKLLEAKSLSFDTKVRVGIPGQGYTSDFVDLDTERQVMTLDPNNKRGMVENWSNHRGAVFHNQNIVNGSDSYAINHRIGTYQAGTDANYHVIFGGFIRGHDTMLAYELSARADDAKLEGSTIYQGRPHQEISFDYPSSPRLHLFVDESTGYISKMTRTVGELDLHYTFDSHTQTKGITYASDFIFFNQGLPSIITTDRTLTVNSARDRDFELSKSLSPAPKAHPNAEGMLVETLTDTMYYVGQNGAHSVFVDTGDQVIGIGAYGGLADRFKAYQEAAGHTKPLAHLVVTHHHQDHIQGAPEAYELGATLLVPPLSRAAVMNEIGLNVSESRITDLEQGQSFGAFEVHLAPTTHAVQNAFIYFPEIKSVLSADHYGNTVAEGASPAFHNALGLYGVLKDLNWDIHTLLDIHAPKPTKWNDFETVVKAYDTSLCPSGRKICRDLS